MARSAYSTGTSRPSGPTAGSTLWEPAAARMPAYGAKSWSLTRAVDDPLSFRQSSVWESRSDFERYWFSEEIETGASRGASTSTTCRCCPPGTPCSPPSRRNYPARGAQRFFFTLGKIFQLNLVGVPSTAPPSPVATTAKVW